MEVSLDSFFPDDAADQMVVSSDLALPWIKTWIEISDEVKTVRLTGEVAWSRETVRQLRQSYPRIRFEVLAINQDNPLWSWRQEQCCGAEWLKHELYAQGQRYNQRFGLRMELSMSHRRHALQLMVHRVRDMARRRRQEAEEEVRRTEA